MAAVRTFELGTTPAPLNVDSSNFCGNRFEKYELLIRH
jgi:hypothetical protein